ncbi:hypothetical protein [Streptomyces sp. B6B3]|uniref:hypothetical protein n=1 Tax=Streptomyces sp. B6B3 TaxID=3153570 RepID=UPI00325C7644
MTTITGGRVRSGSVATRVRRGGWGVLALFLGAFAVFESVKYGVPTTAAALVFFAVPDLFRRHRAAHLGWIPLAVLVVYTVTPIVWPPMFTAGLGWLTRIAIDRTVRRG